MITQKQKTAFIYAIPAALLCIPILGNIFSSEFDWTASDFIIAAVLLFGTAFIIDMVQRVVKNKTYKILICAIIAVLLVLTWVEMAVGLFGTPIAGS
ncbi:hypothetical protein [Chryseobacterium chendengshani]|uniref:hypothetical protein n=1 Tax=unclassified Chryseobacterium TaxID=2593645 RepID=UPI001C641760|nr:MULTISPECIES: hypothetical protein [unclassified Chryseobacterium]MBW7676929.1 hypothetical protein [Chryseobacterium sp. LJ756]MBW8524562.1 hypothetical protein [Chryseobacterium sp. LJ668]QYK17285.1 hypothetical protein K0U91_03940 [Chryseobacterium sp. LJ668]